MSPLIYQVHFSGEKAPHFFHSSATTMPTAFPIETSLEFVKLHTECYSLLAKGYTMTNIIYVSQVLAHLLGLLFFNSGQPESALGGENGIDQAIIFMTDHLHTAVTLKDLATHVKLSKPHFAYLFKQATGYSPIEYYIRLKIQLACQYLDLSGLSVHEISKKLGFKDPYYFSRCFHKIMGYSPTDYRNQKKG